MDQLKASKPSRVPSSHVRMNESYLNSALYDSVWSAVETLNKARYSTSMMKDYNQHWKSCSPVMIQMGNSWLANYYEGDETMYATKSTQQPSARQKPLGVTHRLSLVSLGHTQSSVFNINDERYDQHWKSCSPVMIQMGNSWLACIVVPGFPSSNILLISTRMLI
ncbi:uncharacterized protein LOC117125323 [Anneissia japonica]|uniref:uncharacterized protein LOC117125323 n=1 Tax=Anneissia japonica TaxID=1529436 RepID=UPI0014255957|nr:uncharacterized protein LOC117125323 [Anneissia japonica]